MGTATYAVCNSGISNKNIIGKYITGGAHTSSTSASSLTTGAAGSGSAITAQVGNMVRIRIDEDARLKFGGETPTATDGIPIYANETTDLEVTGNGEIVIIDVA